MKKENKNSYKEQRKKAKEFESREEYLEHELSIMKRISDIITVFWA